MYNMIKSAVAKDYSINGMVAYVHEWSGACEKKALKGPNVAVYWHILFDFTKRSQLYTIKTSMGAK